MEQVLIVEDNDIKFRQVQDVVQRRSAAEIVRAKNQRTAFANLRNGHNDLMLLDMTFEVLANRSQTATLQALAGLQVMQYMKRARLHVPTIVVTQHTSFHQPGTPIIPDVDSLRSVLAKAFPQFYRGCVYMTDGGNWQEELRRYMDRALNG